MYCRRIPSIGDPAAFYLFRKYGFAKCDVRKLHGAIYHEGEVDDAPWA